MFGELVPTLIIERILPVLATTMLIPGSVLEAVFEFCCEVAEALIRWKETLSSLLVLLLSFNFGMRAKEL